MKLEDWEKQNPAVRIFRQPDLVQVYSLDSSLWRLSDYAIVGFIPGCRYHRCGTQISAMPIENQIGVLLEKRNGLSNS